MGSTLANVGIGLAVLFAAFVWWRWTSVARGARRRDDRLLAMVQPIGEKLCSHQAVSRDEVAAFAAKPEARLMLYATLMELGAAELFPDEHLSVASQAEAHLAYWMMHPNEFGDPPAEIAAEAIVHRNIGEHEAAFHVLRFRMPDGHWAGRDWLLGLAGPFFAGDPPFGGPAGAFSRSGDKAGSTAPDELVDWFLRVLDRFGSRRGSTSARREGQRSHRASHGAGDLGRHE